LLLGNAAVVAFLVWRRLRSRAPVDD
jgi:hypothetical protein